MVLMPPLRSITLIPFVMRTMDGTYITPLAVTMNRAALTIDILFQWNRGILSVIDLSLTLGLTYYA